MNDTTASPTDRERAFAAVIVEIADHYLHNGMTLDVDDFHPTTALEIAAAYEEAREIVAATTPQPCPWAPRHSTDCAQYGAKVCDGMRCTDATASTEADRVAAIQAQYASRIGHCQRRIGDVVKDSAGRCGMACFDRQGCSYDAAIRKEATE